MTHHGDIVAIGLAKALFFHPGEHIHNKYPNDQCTRHLENVSITKDGMVPVTDMTNGATLIKNFCDDVSCATVLDAERHQTDLSNPPQDDNGYLLCSLQENIKANVNA